jgi:hypothetical protein
MPVHPPQDQQCPYYRPSGKVAPGALATGVACGLAVVPAAWLYAWVTMRAPACVNVVALAIFGLSIAVVVDVVALKAKVRSRSWIIRFALMLALFAWYVQWAVWVGLERHLPGAGTLALALHPGALLAAAAHIAQHNAWGVGTLAMAAVWLVEAYVLVQLAPGLGLVRVAQPFCEASGTWAEAVAVPRKFAWIAQGAAVAQLLEQSPQQLVSVLSAWTAPAPQYATVRLFRCGAGAAYVTIVNASAGAAPRDVVVGLRLPGMPLAALVDKLVARADARGASRADEDAPIAPELVSAQALYQAAQFADALARAQPHTRAVQGALRLEANRLCALSCMRHGRWGDACGYWQAVFDDEPAVHTALQLAGSLVMAGNLDLGHDWFLRARAVNAATGELPPLSLLTNFVSALDRAGHPASAMRWLHEIRECYCQQGVTDPAVLFANRMPLFNEFLERSAPVVLAALGRQPGLRWFAAMLGRLDEAGNVELGQWLDEQERSLAR